MEAKKAILEERKTQVGDVSLDNYEDDGASDSPRLIQQNLIPTRCLLPLN